MFHVAHSVYIPNGRTAIAGELQSPGTGPFFGQKSHFLGKGLAENMDLSPLRQDFAVLLVVSACFLRVSRL